MCSRMIAMSLTAALVCQIGCARLNNRLADAYGRAAESHELAQIRAETRAALAEQRKAAAAAEAQKRQWEAAFCEANQAAEQRHIQSQIRESVDTEVSFDVNHGMEVGELEVDLPALKDLIDNRTAELNNGGKGCGFADQKCGCAPGLIRRHCHNCAAQKCGCPPEKDCGGPATLRELAGRDQPQIKATEIPMKLPVRLTVGMQNPRVRNTSVRREPVQREAAGKCERPMQKVSHDSDAHLHSVPQPPPPAANLDPTGHAENHTQLQATKPLDFTRYLR